MNNENSQNFENLDIYVLKIIAKKILMNEPVFFNVKSDIIKPIDICIKNRFLVADYESKIADILIKQSERLEKLIKNDASTNILITENEKITELICSLKPEHYDFVKCIKFIDIILSSDKEEIMACKNKVEIKIVFKILLLIIYSSGEIALLMLPDDENKKFCFENSVNFPIKYFDSGIKKILDIDRENKQFILIMIIPFDSFKDNISSSSLESHSLQCKFKIIKKTFFTDIFLDKCSCDQNNGTTVSVEIKADMLIKIGIGQSISI